MRALEFTLNPLTTNPTKWSNRLKQFVGKLPMNCLSLFDHFVKLALKGLSFSISVLQERVHGVMKVFFQVDLLYRNRNSHRKCSVTFLKKRLWYRCFPMKFLGRPFFIEHSVVASVFLYCSYHFLFIILFPVSIINTPSSSKLIF